MPKTLHGIVSEMARNGTVTKVEINRRDLAKMMRPGRQPKRTRVRVVTLMNRTPQRHKSKMYWPVRDETFVLETKANTADTRKVEHPMITARRRQFPKTR